MNILIAIGCGVVCGVWCGLALRGYYRHQSRIDRERGASRSFILKNISIELDIIEAIEKEHDEYNKIWIQ